MSDAPDPEVRVPEPRPSGAAPFLGTWRITKMSVWDQDAVDLCGPGHFSFSPSGTGSLGFIAVEGEMDCRFAKSKDGRATVRFTWSGNDENDQASGRGWATITGKELRGRIFFHLGDDSSFTAIRQKVGRRPPRPRGGCR